MKWQFNEHQRKKHVSLGGKVEWNTRLKNCFEIWYTNISSAIRLFIGYKKKRFSFVSKIHVDKLVWHWHYRFVCLSHERGERREKNNNKLCITCLFPHITLYKISVCPWNITTCFQQSLQNMFYFCMNKQRTFTRKCFLFRLMQNNMCVISCNWDCTRIN